ncbi:hypothetical protein SDC9_206444 [bioreactor metagenome]|uniref:Uncharacterized protein n=1 Tax=bioreactor metagenome TaxID=1076179 RepID=A0A645J528_9ZZZZ
MSEFLLDLLGHFFLDLVAESIAEYGTGFQTLALGKVLEGHGVVPTRGGCLVLARLAFKAHIDGITVVSECGNDA